MTRRQILEAVTQFFIFQRHASSMKDDSGRPCNKPNKETLPLSLESPPPSRPVSSRLGYQSLFSTLCYAVSRVGREILPSPTHHRLTVTVMLLLSTNNTGGSSWHSTSTSAR